MTLNVKHVEVRNQYGAAAQTALAATYFLLTVLATVGNLCVFVINFKWRGGISNFKVRKTLSEMSSIVINKILTSM